MRVTRWMKALETIPAAPDRHKGITAAVFFLVCLPEGKDAAKY